MELDNKSFKKLIRKNPEKAFNYLVTNYTNMVYATCMSFLRNQEDSEDVTQEIFTTVYLSLTSYQGKSKPSTWVYGIALNKSKEFIRHKSRQKRSGSTVELNNDDVYIVPEQTITRDHPGVLLENKERAEILFRAIDQLPENQKIAYSMHKIEGYSYQEIGDLMEMSKSSIESLIFRAKQNLKKTLTDYYEKNER